MVHTIIQRVEDQWDNRGVAFYPGSNMYKFMSALTTEGDRQLETASIISRAVKIRTASGEDLDKLGYAVSLPREMDEEDDRYRKRIQLQYRINSMEATMDEIAQFMASMIEVDDENIQLDTRFDAAVATLFIGAQAEAYDNAPLSRSEIKQFADRIVSAGHRVVLEESGTFLITSDQGLIDDGHLAENGLTSDSIETGGTLAADIITDE